MSNENYYKKYFKGNKHNPINVWKGTKEIMLIKKQINYISTAWK